MKSCLIFLCLVAAAISEQDYCSFTCPRRETKKHVDCRPRSGFGSDCPPNATLLKDNKSVQDIVITYHNVVRNTKSSTGDCQKIKWDDKLAKKATEQAKKCPSLKNSAPSDAHVETMKKVLKNKDVPKWFESTAHEANKNVLPVSNQKNRVGCAVAAYKEGGIDRYWTLCEYSSVKC